MKRLISMAAVAVMFFANACRDKKEEIVSVFPEVEDASAKFVGISDFQLVIAAKIRDNEGLQSAQITHQGWDIDEWLSISGKEYALNKTFTVSKTVDPSRWKVVLTVENTLGDKFRIEIAVADESPYDELSPVIELIKPTVTRSYVIDPDQIPWEIEAKVTDNKALSKVYVKVWNETTIAFEDEWTRVSDDNQRSYIYSKQVNLPGIAEYQYLIRATDENENESERTGNFAMGIMDRLYLSDAKNDFEVTNQGYDTRSGSSAWGLGSLVPMQRTGNNRFVLDYYYRNDADENIRFITFMGDDRPFATSPRGVNYTLDGFNVLGVSKSDPGKVTADKSEANFKLPVEKGYYTITVDMTQRTIELIPLTPTNPDFANATFFPGGSFATNPYDYFAIIAGGGVTGTSGWAEIANNPRISRETEHSFQYSGTFTTVSGSNISFTSPNNLGLAIGWYRVPGGYTVMTDVYGDLVSRIVPIGTTSSNGANFGISLLANKRWYATYDLVTYRLRIVEF